MRKQQILGLLLLLALAVGAIFAAERMPAAEIPPEMHIVVAPLDGETVSPDGQFAAQLVGVNEGVTASGLYAPESIRIVNADTGAVLWEDMGYYEQSVLWSPDSGYVAIARMARTHVSVTVIETESWTSWDVTLPDRSPIPEYTFLPEDWGTWQDEGALQLTIGRGGDAGEQQTYRCSVWTEDGQLCGETYVQTTEILPGNWDFDHDGTPETLTLTSILLPGSWLWSPQYHLNVERQDGTILWTQEASDGYTAGHKSVFACEADGQDYLLQYFLSVGQGHYVYSYRMFSLDNQGNEVPFRENQVEFDFMFGAPIHGGFDPAAIAAFLEEVHGLLDESTLLLSTESGDFRTGGSGADFRDDLYFWTAWGNGFVYDDSLTLEENLRALEAHRSK